MLDVGLAHPERAPWPEIAERAARQTERLEELITQLLALAKADAGQLAARKQSVDVGAVLTEIEATTAAHPKSIEFGIPAGTVVAGNPEDLSRLFRNLVDNAVRYAATKVRVTAEVTPDAVRVEVSDDGPGIPAEERERVFDRFVRLDASRGRGTGGRGGGSAGLGLAIAREIAAAHGATIVVTEADSARAVVTMPVS